MPTSKPYLSHLNGSVSLVTPYEATRAGFVSLALERNRRATPTVVEARNLKTKASSARSPLDLLNIKTIYSAMLTAAGVSDKAAGHLLEKDKDEAIQGLIKNFLEPAGLAFVEELVYRFLLTRGDSLGGSMRNLAGALGQRKFARIMIATLTLSARTFHWLDLRTNSWVLGDRENADIENSLSGLGWETDKAKRTLLFNRVVPIVGNNVDLCLLDCGYQEASAKLGSPSSHIALGELKGGIDPAGADEHWKTARTSLSRIRDAFKKKGFSPQTFFVGAAIEKNMADEIWNQLQNDTLQNAANLTNADQLNSLCGWLSEV